MNTLDPFFATRCASADRPLLGLTVLLVEDSRYASEAMRLLCLRSGARIRRADSLRSAHRHLKGYRPDAVIVDLGLPDGSGLDLIAELAAANPRVDVLLGTSGDPGGELAAEAAGADGFMEKPMARLAEFQARMLKHLPAERQFGGPRQIPVEIVEPDRVAYRDDLELAAQLLRVDWPGDHDVAYLTQFLGGVARGVGDLPLVAAVEDLITARKEGGAGLPAIARVAALVEQRLAVSASL